MIVANDATVKGGTYYPLTVKKHLRAQEIAGENRLPCIYLVESGGAYLPNQDEVFPDREHFGRIFYNQAQLSARGHCADRRGAWAPAPPGGAYVPAMSRRRHHRAQPGTRLPRRPAAGEGGDRRGDRRRRPRRRRRALPALGRDRLLCRRTTCMRWRSRAAPSARLRPRAGMPGVAGARRREPHTIRPRLYGVIPPMRANPTTCGRSSPASSTAPSSTSSRRCTAPPWSAASPTSQGIPVGILANNGILFSESALKGAHFIELCCREGIPLVFLQNISGFMVGRKSRRAASPRMAPSSSPRSPARPCRSSRSSSAAASARATTACAAAPIRRASCSCGRTPASR